MDQNEFNDNLRKLLNVPPPKKEKRIKKPLEEKIETDVLRRSLIRQRIFEAVSEDLKHEAEEAKEPLEKYIGLQYSIIENQQTHVFSFAGMHRDEAINKRMYNAMAAALQEIEDLEKS